MEQVERQISVKGRISKFLKNGLYFTPKLSQLRAHAEDV